MRNWLRDVDDVFLHLLVKPADSTGYRQMEVFDYRSSGGHLFGFIGALGLAEFRCGAGPPGGPRQASPVPPWYGGSLLGECRQSP